MWLQSIQPEPIAIHKPIQGLSSPLYNNNHVMYMEDGDMKKQPIRHAQTTIIISNNLQHPVVHRLPERLGLHTLMLCLLEPRRKTQNTCQGPGWSIKVLLAL